MRGDLPAAELGICETAFWGIAFTVPVAADGSVAGAAEVNHAVAPAVVDLGAVNEFGGGTRVQPLVRKAERAEL